VSTSLESWSECWELVADLSLVRLFLYTQFYNRDTWDLLCETVGGTPTWANFVNDIPAMEDAIRKRQRTGAKIYFGGFQLVPPTVYFTDDRNRSKKMDNFAASLRLVVAMMRAGLPVKLLACKYAVDASYVLQTIPTLGGFLSLNILCYLNDTTHFKWMYRNFATCGPSSRYCMQRMFGREAINSVAMEEAGLLWLTEHQYRYYARLSLDPPHDTESGLRPGLRSLDVENALCWCHRYINAYERKGVPSFADDPLPMYAADADEAGAPAWCIEQRWADSSSRTSWDAARAEKEDRLGAIDGEDADVFEVEKVIARRGTAKAGSAAGMFRVRWKGWMPEEDTWESASQLKDGAEEVSRGRSR
jgi:hypothetical protein